MLQVIVRESLGEEIRRLLGGLHLTAYTEAPKVCGIGDAGMAEGTFEHPGYNSLILSALEDDRANEVITGIQRFRDDLSGKQHGAGIPLHAFILPCEQVV